MTPTQIARRSDALYADGTCGMTRRVLCDMVAQRESDLEDAMAENDRLWKYVTKLETANLDVTARLTDYIGQYDPTDAFVAEVKAENAKLRELVKDFDKCLTEAVRLAYIQGHATIYDGTLLDSLHPRMRELGVEVDG